MNEQKTDIKSLTPGELTDFIKTLGQPAFRAKQIYGWMYRPVWSFEEMTDLPRMLRKELEEKAFLARPETLRLQRSAADGTVKSLRAFSGSAVESVFMKYHHGNTLCLSSQSGCRMGCVFCASSVHGLDRNLRPSEMIDQILCMEEDEGQKISNLVLMGTGEPLDNYDNVVKFLQIVRDPEGLGLSHRHISLSTCGLADKILKLAEMNLQLTLSVSLHAPTDEIRNQLMPVNRAWPIEKLMSACRTYFEKTRRRISFEYAMIDGVNDSGQCAKELARILRGMPAHVNLIPLNRVAESGLSGSSRNRVYGFQKELMSLGVNATVRRTLGPDIDASCGQLRNRIIQEGRTANEPVGEDGYRPGSSDESGRF